MALPDSGARRDEIRISFTILDQETTFMFLWPVSRGLAASESGGRFILSDFEVYRNGRVSSVAL